MRLCPRLVSVLAVVTLLGGMPRAVRAAGDDVTQEANALADKAFKDFEAKRFRDAAQGFLRAYEMTGSKFPKQLRNAAKALYAGGFLEEALGLWRKLQAVGDPEMQAEAREQVLKVRSELANRFQQQGQAARRGKQFGVAGDDFAQGFQASGGTRSDLLLATAESYEAAGRLDDALLAWQLATQALAAQPDARSTAQAGQERLLNRLRKLPHAADAYAAWSDKKWPEAATLLLTAYEKSRERAHLRLAALALDEAGRRDDAETTWTRYLEAAHDSQLAQAEAHRRLDDLRTVRIAAQARAEAAAGRDAAAAEKWLALFEISSGRAIDALREAALALDRAGERDRAATWWKRLADMPEAPESWRREALERLARPNPTVAVRDPARPVPLAAAPTPVLVQGTEAAPCGWCPATMIGGGVAVVAGGVLVVLAHGNQGTLLDKAGRTSGGLVTGVDYSTAMTQQDRNNLMNGLGIGLVAAGVAVSGASAVMQWLMPHAPAVAAVPTPTGAQVVLTGHW